MILDAKRGDIGSTAEQYAREAFERYGADAVTVNPYLGRDSVEPYLAHTDKGVILLCRTSNPGGSDLQFCEVARESGGTERLYERVARLVATSWNRNGNCALVVGATFPQELARVRELDRRYAAAGARHRRAGRRHRGDGQGRSHQRRQRADDQFVARRSCMPDQARISLPRRAASQLETRDAINRWR